MATLRPSGSSIAIYYVVTDQLSTPREVVRPSDNTVMWSWFTGPFGTEAPNTNPQGVGTFTYDLRFPGQVAGAWGSTYQNNQRDFDPATGRYDEPDPTSLSGGSFSTYAYVLDDPLMFIDPLGLYWEYCINTGAITYVDDGTGHRTFISYGYSGIGGGYNNPSAEAEANVGPIPEGSYGIGQAYNSLHTGPLTLPLSPLPGANTFGRDLFRIHGDKKHGPRRRASNGCIIAPLRVRQLINNSSDKELKVVTCD